MTKSIAPPQAEIRPLPYVTGTSSRFKAKPTKLSPLAGRIMLASGAFSTRRKVVSLPLGRIAGAMAILSMAVALGLGGVHRPVDDQTQMADARLVQADDRFTLGAGDKREHAAIVADGASDFDGQNEFEIARLVRLRSVVRQEQTNEDRSRPSRSPNIATR